MRARQMLSCVTYLYVVLCVHVHMAFSQTPVVHGTKTLDVRGFDSTRILTLGGGTLMSIGNFPEVLSQRILAGIALVGRLGVMRSRAGLQRG